MTPTNETPTQRLAVTLAAGCEPEQLLHVIRQALTADVVARDGTRSPDHRTRLDGAKLLLAYSLGTPVARTENVTVAVDADSALGMEERLRHSPALRAMFRKMLEKVEDGQPAIEA